MSAITAVVGRQPVVDAGGALVGYELLFRPLSTSQTAIDPDAPREWDGDQMTNEVIFGALGLGIDRLTGGRTMFCNADRGVLTGRLPVSLPPKQTVIEILESVAIDEEVFEGCRALKRAGYRLAADDFTWFDGAEGLLELVDIVKIDVRTTPLAQIPALIARCRPFGAQLLAEKIETAQELAACRRMGFDLFQGYFLGRPVTISGTAIGPSRHGTIRLASAVLDDNVHFAVIEQILRTEPELCYQLVQLAALGRFGETRRAVHSLRQALVLIGLDKLRGWIPALLLRPAGKAVDTNLPTMLARARMAELLAAQLHPGREDVAFTAGMFSAFDLLLGVPNDRLPEMLEIPLGLRQAIFDRDTPVGRLVGWVIDYEHYGTFPPADCGIDRAAMLQAASCAFGWAIRHTEFVDHNATSATADMGGSCALAR